MGARQRRLSVVMWLVLGADLVWLALRQGHVVVAVNGALESLTVLLPVALCWCAVPAAGARRREVSLVALAETLFATGVLSYMAVVVVTGNDTPPFPSLADVFYLPTYVVLLGAVTVSVRRELRTVSGAVLLDGLLGGLGAATVLSVLLRRVFTQHTGTTLATVVSLAYPLLDMLLVAAVVGVVALQGVQRRWLPLLLGLGVFAAADMCFALREASADYTVGTPFDALWAVGLALVAAWGSTGRDDVADSSPGAGALTVPAVATASCLAVLVWATRSQESLLTISLATLTLLVTAARTQLSFGHVRKLADLRRQAATDELTGLPNRRAFAAHMTARLADGGPASALLVLDLDRFKEVNDSLGHQVGDQLLEQVGARLAQQLRGGDMLARLGGDEFAVLLQDVDRVEAFAVAEKLRAALQLPFQVEGFALRTGVSTGIAMAPEHGRELSVLLRRADIAMYRAKRSHQGTCSYRPDDDDAGAERLLTLEELRTALVQEQLTVHYQPKLDLGADVVRGVEALVRWEHPYRGLLHPDSFLALTEEAGLMADLTDVVLDLALDQAAVWQAQGRTLTVAVNVSASSLVDVHLPDRVAGRLAARGLPAAALQLEITEDFVMADRERARGILTRLREIGIQIAVDDFGTGYSSLAYLRDLPIDELKLDRSFVFPMAEDGRAAALVFSTIGLAHSLGLRMVAEGVEDEVSLQQLRDHGCDQAQGFHVSRPVPAAVLEHWLDRRPLPRPRVDLLPVPR